MDRTFRFDFEDPYRKFLRLLGVRPDSAYVLLDDAVLDVHFGRWNLCTPVANVVDTTVTGPYTAVKAIGPRASFRDRGATFGSSTRRGLCLRFDEPEPALFGPVMKHPGLTVTVEDPEGLQAAIAAVRGGAAAA